MIRSLSLLTTACLILPSCSPVGPDYKQPLVQTAATYKNVGLSTPPAAGDWWSAFSDSTLTSLLRAAEKGNPTSNAALARLDQARATLGIRRSDLLPAVSASALGDRTQESSNDRFPSPGGPFNRFSSTLNLTYEIDFWGRVRRGIAQERATAQAAAADYSTALLSTRAEITRNYVALRSLDREITLLKDTIGLRSENERLVDARVQVGDTTAIDSSRAKSQTETVRAERFRLQQRRDELENAIAVLVGASPSNYRLKAGSPPRTPRVSSGVPADLLRRRPDVYASERRLAAASEAIGVTIGNYLPRISLTASGGFGALSSSDLFNRSSRLWDLGTALTGPVFTAGRRQRDIERSKALYREALESHRAVVLGAFRDVENALSGISNLDRALAAQEKSATAAEDAARLVQLRYDGGLVSFFEVIEAQRLSLTEQRALVQTRSARQLASVQLIQALGGGWKSPRQ